MNDHKVEVDVCYKDYFIEVHTIDHLELNPLIQTLANDKQKSFEINDKNFLKKELNSVSIANHGYGFIFTDTYD